MQTGQRLTFGPYRFDPRVGQLWRGKQEVSLTRKATSVLHYLLAHAGQVVTKEEVFQAVWADTVVSDAALTSCIQELRQALHDHARKPRFIETVHRRGFRFLGRVVSNEDNTPRARSREHGVKIPFSSPTLNTQSLAPGLVGREAELAFLHERLAKALNGERQIIFVTGEAGIGKTTLVEAFVQGLTPRVQRQDEARPQAGSKEPGAKRNRVSSALSSGLSAPCCAKGQCIEHYGAGEAYLPVLEALGRLCREQTGTEIIALLRQHAPSWLVQMPSLLSTTELEELQRRTGGVTRERMLRELAEALEVLTAERPLILVLEDLHWSDVSTLDLLSMLARRQDPARLLIIGTYRPVEVLTRAHPLKAIKQELQLHGQCEELALDFLREDDVAEYLALRFPVGATGRSPLPLAHLVHRRTDGNPLFMVNLINHLLSQGVLVQTGGQLRPRNEDLAATVPENLRQLIEQQLNRVNHEERKILEAASVAGAEFSAAAVAAGMEHSIEAVETHCDTLVRREQFLRVQGTSEWPDGTVAMRYGFIHALYQEVVYAQLSASRRIRLHQQIGEREEAAYGQPASEIAAELALHFERGRDYRKAVRYLQQAGENAIRRSAHQEAINLLTKGLELLKLLPDTLERAQLEFTLRITLGVPLMAIKGYADSQVGNTYARALELSEQLENPQQRGVALDGFLAFCLVRAEHGTASQLAEQFLSLARHTQDPRLLVEAHRMLGESLFWRGDLMKARSHLERSTAVYDPHQHHVLPFLYGGPDIEVANRAITACALWHLGYPDQALKSSHAALTLAQELAHPLSHAFALDWAITLWQYRHDIQEVQERADALIALAGQQGFLGSLVGGTLARGWVLVEQGQGEESIIQLCQSLATYQTAGTELGRPTLLAHLANAYGKVGQIEEGLRVLTEALVTVDKTGERISEAELYRLKGELTLQKSVLRSLASEVTNSPESKVPSLESEEETQNSKVKAQKSKVLNPKSQILDPQGEAEEYFLKAIEIARQQQAKSLELRATVSLARLRQQQALGQSAKSKGGRARNTQPESRARLDEGHQMLSDIYNWFTEGFDTKDLQEAKALLEELKH